MFHKRKRTLFTVHKHPIPFFIPACRTGSINPRDQSAVTKTIKTDHFASYHITDFHLLPLLHMQTL